MAESIIKELPHDIIRTVGTISGNVNVNFSPMTTGDILILTRNGFSILVVDSRGNVVDLLGSSITASFSNYVLTIKRNSQYSGDFVALTQSKITVHEA